MHRSLEPYRYHWPQSNLRQAPGPWRTVEDGRAVAREMPEEQGELGRDSRWPAFFPCPISLVTTSDGAKTALERAVGASIVNRFPYTLAISVCRKTLSTRHHARRVFMDTLERSGTAAVQFLAPGHELDRALNAITSLADDQTHLRIGHSNLPTHRALTNDAAVFDSAYMVYEVKLVKPGRDLHGASIFTEPWIDAGSHRIYFLEISAIQLRQDIAAGENQIVWQALPEWNPLIEPRSIGSPNAGPDPSVRYKKSYNPLYAFPSASTTAFEADTMHNGMAVKYLPSLPADQIETDNDRARWPCFYPSSVGMITTWASDGTPNVMPCGSTTVVSRHPFTIAPCVSYAAINERYAPRATLDIIRRTGRFGCAVPFMHDQVVRAIRYAGNVSFTDDPHKLANAGLEVVNAEWAPVLSALPIHFDCEVVQEVPLGTHIMFLGQVRRIRVRTDVTPENPIQWCPWPTLRNLASIKNDRPSTHALAAHH